MSQPDDTRNVYFFCRKCDRRYRYGDELKEPCCIQEYREARERFGIVDLKLVIPEKGETWPHMLDKP